MSQPHKSIHYTIIIFIYHGQMAPDLKVLSTIQSSPDFKVETSMNHRLLNGVDNSLQVLHEESEICMKTRFIQFALVFSEKINNIVSVALDGAMLNVQKMYKSYHLFVTRPLREEWSTMEAEIEADFEPSLLQIIANTALSGYIKDKKSLPNQAFLRSPT